MGDNETAEILADVEAAYWTETQEEAMEALLSEVMGAGY